MEENIGKTDKSLRVVIGVLLFGIGLVEDVGSGIKVVIFILSATALFTAIFGT